MTLKIYNYKSIGNLSAVSGRKTVAIRCILTIIMLWVAAIGYASDTDVERLIKSFESRHNQVEIANSLFKELKSQNFIDEDIVFTSSTPLDSVRHMFYYWIGEWYSDKQDYEHAKQYGLKTAQFESKYGNGNATLGNMLIASKKPAVAEPKGVSVSADIKAMGDKAGKEITYGEYEKLIYHDSKWTVLKENVWPYKIKGYSIPVSIVYKKDGKRWGISGALVKAPQGNKCFVQNGDASTASPLK